MYSGHITINRMTTTLSPFFHNFSLFRYRKGVWFLTISLRFFWTPHLFVDLSMRLRQASDMAGITGLRRCPAISPGLVAGSDTQGFV